MGDAGKAAPAPQTQSKEGEPKIPGREAGARGPAPREKRLLGASEAARARGGKRGRLEASVPESRQPAAVLGVTRTPPRPARSTPAQPVLTCPPAPEGQRGCPPRLREEGDRRRTGLQGPGPPAFSGAFGAPLPRGTPDWASEGSQPFHEVSATSPRPPKTSNKRTFANFPLRSLSDFGTPSPPSY